MLRMVRYDHLNYKVSKDKELSSTELLWMQFKLHYNILNIVMKRPNDKDVDYEPDIQMLQQVWRDPKEETRTGTGFEGH